MDRTHEKKLRLVDYLVVASMLFGLFFGAGNLIFPLHLGQLAGKNWAIAVAGFLITGVVLPLLSVLAIAVTRSKGVYDIGRPLGPAFAIVFMVLIHATIGPFFGTPRTATVSFTVGIEPFIPSSYRTAALLIFSALFFIFAFLLSYKENSILSNIGKVLNPLFLILLFIVFFMAFISPLGNSFGKSPQDAHYISGAFTNGLLEGYNTMDVLAGLAFGVTVVTTIRLMGVRHEKNVASVTAKSGTIAMFAVAVIYILLIAMGAMSLGRFTMSSNGGIVFSQIVQAYAGKAGQALLAALIVVTCLTTAVGLVAAFAQDFHNHFPKVSYHTWLALCCILSFIIANFGLDTIIAWSTPVLMLLYPFAMVLILLSVCSPLFKRDRAVYGWVIGFTAIPALMDMVVSFPDTVSKSSFALFIARVRDLLPLADYGLSWLLPAVAGAVIGLAVHLYKLKAKPEAFKEYDSFIEESNQTWPGNLAADGSQPAADLDSDTGSRAAEQVTA